MGIYQVASKDASLSIIEFAMPNVLKKHNCLITQAELSSAKKSPRLYSEHLISLRGNSVHTLVCRDLVLMGGVTCIGEYGGVRVFCKGEPTGVTLRSGPTGRGVRGVTTLTVLNVHGEA